MTRHRTLMLVGCGVMGAGYLRASARLGLNVVLVETAARVASLRHQFDHITATETLPDSLVREDVAWVGPASALAKRTSPDAVLAFTEPHVLAAALIAAQHGLRGPGLFASVVSRNKALQRALIREGPQVRHPSSLLTVDDSAAVAWSEAHMPVVVKELSLAGSEGIERADTAPEVVEAFTRSKQAMRLVEAFVDGVELVWTAVVSGGHVLHDHISRSRNTGELSGSRGFVELGHLSSLEDLRGTIPDAVRELARTVTRDMNVADGIVCIEVRVDDEGHAHLIEFMVRMPGDHVMDHYSAIQRVDPFEAHIRACLGDGPGPQPVVDDFQGSVSVATHYWTTASPGTVSHVDFGPVQASPGVIHCGSRLRPGDPVRTLQSSADRLGYVVLGAPSTAELRRRLHAVAKLDPVQIVPRVETSRPR